LIYIEYNFLDFANSNNAHDIRSSEKTPLQNHNIIPRNNNNIYNIRGKSNELAEIFQELKVEN